MGALPHLYKPGQSGNPSGRPKMSEEEIRIRTLTNKEFFTLADKLLKTKQEKLREILRNGTTSSHEAMLASIIDKIIKQGDASKYSIILDRIVGKPREIDPVLDVNDEVDQEKLAKVFDLLSKKPELPPSG